MRGKARFFEGKPARFKYARDFPFRCARQRFVAQVEIGRLEDRLATLNDARKPHVARLRSLPALEVLELTGIRG